MLDSRRPDKNWLYLFAAEHSPHSHIRFPTYKMQMTLGARDAAAWNRMLSEVSPQLRVVLPSYIARLPAHNCMYIVAADVAAVAVLFRQRWGHTLTSHYGDALLGAPASAHGPRFSPLYEELAKQRATAVAPLEAKEDDVGAVPPPLPPQPEETEEKILEDMNVPAEVDVTSPTDTTSV